MKTYQRIKVLLLLVPLFCEVSGYLVPNRGFAGPPPKYLCPPTSSKARLFASITNSERIAISQKNETITRAESLDAMRARAGLLRTSIVKKQMELQELERQIICCSQSDDETVGAKIVQTLKTFSASANVLIRKLARVQTREGPNNKKWNSVGEFVASQTHTGARIVTGLLANPTRLQHLVDPQTPTLVPHVPAILARLDRLESHVAPILERVLNNRQHLASIEPYLPEILERLDDIEPHLPWILENIDTLAPYTGLLLKHIDELLLYANDDGDSKDSYELAEQLLPYLEYYVSRLDLVGPHLPLLRPHVPLLLKHKRIAKVSPHIDRLFAKGYRDLSASANMDVLLFWFGWTLRVPGLPWLFFRLPGSPSIVSFLANRLPKRFVRGYCRGVSCYIDGD
eukprot:CAMPEP_0178895090 /NCGR_PEP_ID=MMETSP0786-20121207/384_1 /TAXON_ID=186022 /ORGANISM="Thalassionema frauenfeldii, Strain CCMP 1798" /LENGTH=398 /DNA_ID=CAMNT_0020565263 /DNA_START=179 /DNA_END=1372 /DNA_ORIENTATION=+